MASTVRSGLPSTKLPLLGDARTMNGRRTGETTSIGAIDLQSRGLLARQIQNRDLKSGLCRYRASSGVVWR